MSGNTTGGTGFGLSFSIEKGSYGKGGDAQNNSSKDNNASGGSGGHNSNYISVTPSKTYSCVVGNGGTALGTHGLKGNSGFVLIAYGQGIE